jgi:uncharacterized protein (TIGR00251 family)
MTRGGAQLWRSDKAGLLLRARVTPKSARDAVEGVMETAEGPALKVRVCAVAEDGEANRSVVGVVAEWLGVPKGHVSIAYGGKSRVKTLSIAGRPNELRSLLVTRLAELEGADVSV